MTPKQKYDERKRLRAERLLRQEQALLDKHNDRLRERERADALDRRMLRFLIAAERIADVMELWADQQTNSAVLRDAEGSGK